MAAENVTCLERRVLDVLTLRGGGRGDMGLMGCMYMIRVESSL